jgi:type II secretory pathway component PulK
MNRQAERGLALVTALLAAALLTLLTAVMVAIGQRQVELLGLLEQRLRLELRADSALAEGLYALAVEGRWAGSVGQWRDLPAGDVASERRAGDRTEGDGGGDGVVLRWRLVDLSGRLNPTAALLPGLFRRYLERKGVVPHRAAALEAELGDWIENDRLRRLNGAVARDYQAGGFPYLPRGDRQLQHVAELRLLHSMDEALFEMIAAELTLEMSDVINVDSMPDAVALALAEALPGAVLRPSAAMGNGDVAQRPAADAARRSLVALRHIQDEVVIGRELGKRLRIEVQASRAGVRLARSLEVRLRSHLTGYVDSGSVVASPVVAGGDRPWSIIRWGAQ